MVFLFFVDFLNTCVSYVLFASLYTGYNTYYRRLYYCHKQAFLLYASTMEGNLGISTKTGEKLNATCNWDMTHNHFSTGFLVYSNWLGMSLIRFGQFKLVLSLINDANTIYQQSMFEFTNAFSLASLKECDKAQSAYNEFVKISTSNNTYLNISVDSETMKYLFSIANYSYLARYNEQCVNDKSSQEMAINYWNKSVILQNNFPYNEPPSWPFNIASCLGQSLLDAKNYQEAYQVFLTDLTSHPLNGWSLKGAVLALEGLNAPQSEIDFYQSLFDEAWQYSDVNLDVACF